MDAIIPVLESLFNTLLGYISQLANMLGLGSYFDQILGMFNGDATTTTEEPAE